MPISSTRGLQSSAQEDADIDAVQWATAAGTANAITAAFSPVLTALTNGLAVGVRHTTTNTSTTPTLNADGTGNKTIVKEYDAALEPGDIPQEALYRYKSSASKWILLNPRGHFRTASAYWAVAAGTVSAITAVFSPPLGALGASQDGLEVTIRALGANTSTTPTFAPDGFTARTIKKLGGIALAPNDILGANHELRLKFHYDAGTPWWELMNPANALMVKWLTADGSAGADVDTAQNVGLTVAVGVGSYRFKFRAHLSRAAGAGAHTTSFLFGGTCTVSAIYAMAGAKEGDANDLQDMSKVFMVSNVATVVKASSTSTTEQIIIEVEGILTTTVAGTLIPQYKFSAAPGGAATPKAGCYLELEPVTNATGTWT